MTELPAEARRILDEPNLASFVTIMRDGSPQVTPVWVDHDGTHVLINTAEGRQKALNLRRDNRVAVLVVDRDDDQRYVQVRGRAVDLISGDEAWQSIDRLAKKYSGDPNHAYPRREGEERLLVKILPEHVFVRGASRGAPAPR